MLKETIYTPEYIELMKWLNRQIPPGKLDFATNGDRKSSCRIYSVGEGKKREHLVIFQRDTLGKGNEFELLLSPELSEKLSNGEHVIFKKS